MKTERKYDKTCKHGTKDEAEGWDSKQETHEQKIKQRHIRETGNQKKLKLTRQKHAIKGGFQTFYLQQKLHSFKQFNIVVKKYKNFKLII